MIVELTSEQEALIPVYVEKWRANALSTEGIDCQKATEAVRRAYALLSFSEPEILFFDSPYQAFCTIVNQLELQLTRQVNPQLESQL